MRVWQVSRFGNEGSQVVRDPDVQFATIKHVRAGGRSRRSRTGYRSEKKKPEQVRPLPAFKSVQDLSGQAGPALTEDRIMNLSLEVDRYNEFKS